MSHIGTLHQHVRGDLAWRDRAVCVDHDPETFTPEIGASVPAPVRAAHTQAVLKALRVCGTCPVRRECLADAYATGDKWTIRGGTTGEERVEARRRRFAKAGAR